MENKYVGWIILALSAVIVMVIFLFRNALTKIVDASCSEAHGAICPMYMTINEQTYLSLGIVWILAIIGVVLIFSKPTERIVIKKVPERKIKKKIDLGDLRGEDRKVFKIVQEGGAAFQADLIEKTGFGKAKMSRVLDRLEGRGLVERKRRGMTNVVVLKD